MPLIFGLPMDPLFRAAALGLVALGGCTVGEDPPGYHCLACRADVWRDSRHQPAGWSHEQLYRPRPQPHPNHKTEFWIRHRGRRWNGSTTQSQRVTEDVRSRARARPRLPWSYRPLEAALGLLARGGLPGRRACRLGSGSWASTTRSAGISRHHQGDRITLGFAEIADLVGGLPASASEHQAWWSNSRSHPNTVAWLDAGWVVES